jgi:trigger factor
MKVTQEKLPASKIGLEIEIPAEMSKKVYEKVIQDLARTANIPGFRKGKVPRQILLQRLGHQRIKAAALEDLIQESLREAVKQESIAAIGNFELISSFDELIAQFKPGEPLTVSASVDVPPEVTIQEYSNLTVKAEETPFDPSEVDKFLEERRTEKATLIPVEGRSAQMGDVAVVDYNGQFLPEQEGEASIEIPGAQATDFEIELTEGRFLEDIINGIVGMNPGETKEVSVNFPEQYGREDLAGKTAIFTLTLKDLKEKELPVLDDDFAQEVSEFENLAQLRESLETQFREKAEQETNDSIDQAILDELLNHIEIDLPESMIEQEVETILTQTAMQLENYGMDVKKLFNAQTIPQMKQRSRPDAINRLKKSLALEEIAKRESLEPQPDEIDAKVKEVTEQFAGQEVNLNRLRNLVTTDLTKEKAIKWLKEHATVERVPKGSLKPEETSEMPEIESSPGDATIEVAAETVSETNE